MEELLGRIERYLRRSGTKPTRFGRDAARDPRFVFDLRRGRQPGARLRSRIAAFLDEAEPKMAQPRQRLSARFSPGRPAG